MKPVKVLLIEDNPGDERLIGDMLAHHGQGRFRVETVGQNRGEVGGNAGGWSEKLLPENQKVARPFILLALSEAEGGRSSKEGIRRSEVQTLSEAEGSPGRRTKRVRSTW